MKIVDILGARVFQDEERIIIQVIWRSYLTLCVLVAGGEPQQTQHLILLFTHRGRRPTVSTLWSRAKWRSWSKAGLVLMFVKFCPFVYGDECPVRLVVHWVWHYLRSPLRGGLNCSVTDHGWPAGSCGGGACTLRPRPVLWGVGAGHQSTARCVRLCRWSDQMFGCVCIWYIAGPCHLALLIIQSPVVPLSVTTNSEHFPFGKLLLIRSICCLILCKLHYQGMYSAVNCLFCLHSNRYPSFWAITGPL